MLKGLNSIGSIFIMIALGFYLAKRGVLDKKTNNLFSKLVIQVGFPLMVISNLPKNFTLEGLISSSKSILVAFLIILISYGLAYIMTLFLKVDKKERGVYSVLFSLGNATFIGLPINISLFGEKSIPYIFLYYIANTFTFWTLGVYNIKKHSSKIKETGIIATIKRVFSPPLLGFIIGTILIITKINLPEFLDSSFTYMGQLSTPLSMLFIGTVIYNINFKELKIDLTTITIIIGKFFVVPITAIILLSFFNFPDLLNKVFIVQAAAPIITQVALVTEYYDVNSKYSAFMVGLSTIAYMFILPIYIFFIL
ncbi:MAG TPA: AEC family transporter [Eubacteriaceae bacterium]|jgi:predicted permease|nr:AEC family transporter [Eubacteriaceae bacterium]